jgi:NAD(P)-dependent dehydrogenase (short-subunit alcohol dehydrogenase family)
LDETVAEIAAAGGRGVGVRCDHHDDAQVRALFERVRREAGRLDVLVNNVYSSPDLAPWLGRPFWELPLEAWDQVVGIGVRTHYVASALGVPMMVEAGGGLVVNISSKGAERYMHNVVYGVGKAALDRMTADCAHELAPHGVAVVSLWPGLVRTEWTGRAPRDAQGRQLLSLPEGVVDLAEAETPRFTGRAVAALAADAGVARHSGRALRVSELAALYGFTDVDGRVPALEFGSRTVEAQGPAPTPGELLG